MTHRVLVTDGDTRAALAVTRSLGRAGHTVVVAEKRTPALAQTSRYCSARVTYPAPERDEAGCLDAIAAAVAEHRIDVLMPVADICTMLLARHRARFEPACRLPFASAEALERAADKAELVDTALRLGVPVPHSLRLERAGDPVPDAITYPVVIKPHRSRVRTNDGWRSCSVSYAADAPALARELARRHPAEYPLLLQERLVGPGLGVFLCYDRGRVIGVCSHRRLREKPPWGGVSVLSESIAVRADARLHAERLLTALGWHGVAMVEFKVDQRDDVPKLMEINGRFWGSLQLAIDAGVDFPAMLVETLDRAEPAAVPSYRTGIRNRWFWGDVDSLLTSLTAPAAQLPAGSSRLGALAEFCKLWSPSLYYENPKADDVRPWLHESWRWLRRRP